MRSCSADLHARDFLEKVRLFLYQSIITVKEANILMILHPHRTGRGSLNPKEVFV